MAEPQLSRVETAKAIIWALGQSSIPYELLIAKFLQFLPIFCLLLVLFITMSRISHVAYRVQSIVDEVVRR